MKRALRILVPAIVLGAAAALVARYLQRQAADDPGLVRVSGNIEVTDIELGFKIPGRLEAREVSEGESVKAGQVVARLEKADLEQERALREAEANVARAALAELEAGTRPEEIAQGEAMLALGRAEAEKARLEFARQKDLYAKSVATSREFEYADAARKTTEAKSRELEERLALLKKGPREEQLEQARARLQQAKRLLALAETRLGYATLEAPMAGVVLSHNAHPGEYLSPGTPVITIGDLDRPWLRAYVNETDLGRVKLGQAVDVTTDTYPGKKHEARISFISAQAEFTPKNVQTRKERVKLVYRIKASLSNPNHELKPGMPADAEIRLHERDSH